MRVPAQRKHVFGALALAAALILAAGCGGGTTATTASGKTAPAAATTSNATGKVFTVVQSAEPITLDPENTGDNVGLGVERAIYQGLFGFDQNMKLQPVLAKSYEVSSDALTYTFHLQTGVKFSDGTPFDAQAVKVNLERVADQANHLNKYSLFNMIKTITAVDASTVEVTLQYPFSSFLDNLGHPSAGMISPAALKQYGNSGIATHPVGTGPFMLKDWSHGNSITMVKNPNYWQPGQPYFDQIVFKDVPDASQGLAMLKTGEAQFVYPLAPVDAKALASDAAVKVVNQPSVYVTWLTMNQLHEPYSNKDVRLALNYAIDKNALIQSLYQGDALAMNSAMGSQIQYFKNVGSYPFDLAKAKQLMQQAGYGSGFTTTLWSGNSSFAQEEGVFIQQQLAQIGVKVQITPMESGTLHAAITKPAATNQSQLLLTGFSPSNGAADWALRAPFAKSSWPPNLFNYGFYSDDQVNNLFQAALTTTDTSKEASDYAQAQQLMFADAPIVWLVEPTNVWGEVSSLQNAYVVPDQTLEVQFASMK